MKWDVLTVGGATQDIFIEYPCTDLLTFQSVTSPRSFVLLEEGKKLLIDTLNFKTGGGATNSAVSFAKFGFDTAIFCKIGDDEAGRLVSQELKAYGITCDAILTTTAAHTGTSFIIPCPSGNRAVLVYRGANLLIEQHELPVSAIAHSRLLYVTSLSGATAPLLTSIVHNAKQHGCMVAVNPGTSQLVVGAQHIAPALAYIDIFILNLYEAQLLMQTLAPSVPFDIKRSLDEISARGPKTVAITAGADGVYLRHEGVHMYHPSLKVPVTSTLGAGDAFGSCFVASLMRKKTVEDALRAGIINSASVLAHADCKEGLLDERQLGQKLALLNQHLLKRI